MNHINKNSSLSGADWFMLAMDPHMTRYKPIGNICRYALFVNGRLDAKLIKSRIEEKKVFDWLSRMKIKKGLPFQIPSWVPGEQNPFIKFNVHESDSDEIPADIFEQDLRINCGTLFQIDLVNTPGGKSIFVFSWHHILLDGKGAGTLLKYLNGDLEVTDHSCLTPSKHKGRSISENYKNMMETKDFLKESSRKPIAGFMTGDPNPNPSAHYSIIKFDIDQTERIKNNSLAHGSRFGISPYYLAATTRAAHCVLKKRGVQEASFWIPVPQDERLRGAVGPIITNQLSFIFYRIPVKALESLRSCVSHITLQMIEQIKASVPKKYGNMMDWFRRLPLKPYYHLIKGPAGGSIASFLFSVAAESPNELRSFFGYKVEDAVNFPPNTYPPGFTVVFMHFNGTLKIIIGYVEQIISTEEIRLFEEKISKDLLEGDIV